MYAGFCQKERVARMKNVQMGAKTKKRERDKTQGSISPSARQNGQH